MRRSLTTPDRRQTPPPLAVVRQRKTPAAPRYTVSASGSPVRNENLLLQLKFCSLQSPMHYLSCEKSGLGELFLGRTQIFQPGASVFGDQCSQNNQVGPFSANPAVAGAEQAAH